MADYYLLIFDTYRVIYIGPVNCCILKSPRGVILHSQIKYVLDENFVTILIINVLYLSIQYVLMSGAMCG